MSRDGDRKWIDELEIEDVNVKWGWSHFAGEKKGFNEEGQYNFVAIIPEEDVDRLRADGWNVKMNDPYEEGDPPEFTLEINISDKFGLPPIYFLTETPNGKRKIMLEKITECKAIKRASVESIDVIVQPSPWENSGRTGITGYVKEMYVKMITSRFDDKYDDYESI